MKITKALSVFVSLMICSLSIFGQVQMYKGQVKDASGKSLEGITITSSDAQKRTITNEDGLFSIQVKKGSKITFTGIGVESKTIEAGANSSLNVVLDIKISELNDVVVVGFGTQKKVNLTGSVVTLKNEDLVKRQVATASNLLQGLVPGVTVTQQSGKPGADGASINIRGLSSIYAGQSPLILVDGVVSSLDKIGRAHV